MMQKTLQLSEQQLIEKQEKQLALLSRQVVELEKRVRYLERENSRRKTETSQITNALRK